MNEMLLGKYGEIALKGLNKRTFEDVLIKNLRRRLEHLGKFQITKAQSIVYIKPVDEKIDVEEAFDLTRKVFGFSKVAKALILEKDWEDIALKAPDYLEENLMVARSFKVVAKRADKKFPMNSPQLCTELGGVLLKKFPHLLVDVHNPDVTVTIEIREKNAFLHANSLPGAGGMPIGTAGKGFLMLSGGIDSPVAGFMMSKRGMSVSAIHFESPPYTSERARMKVEQLAGKMSAYCGRINFFSVPFTKIQEKIREKCPEDLFTIIMRRLMIEIAQKIAEKEGIQCLITGESIGQVASQTIQAVVCTDEIARMPIFRPLIGMDKTEIIEIARRIDTFETSILPYEDCCTVFTPKHPRTKPSIKAVLEGESHFDFTELIDEAIAGTVPFYIDGKTQWTV